MAALETFSDSSFSTCTVNPSLGGGTRGALEESQHLFCFQTSILNAHLENDMSHQAQVMHKFISNDLEAPFSTLPSALKEVENC